MDVHVDGRVTRGLLSRGHDVLRAQDDAAAEFTDFELLDRATKRNCVMVTYDNDFLAEAATRLDSAKRFCELIFVHPTGMTIGQ